jgi:protein-tyrosine phosphatase
MAAALLRVVADEAVAVELANGGATADEPAVSLLDPTVFIARDFTAGDLDGPLTVASAGLLESGRPVAPEVVRVMTPYGIDLAAHHATRLSAAAVEGADLVLGMERRHGREAILLVPPAWSRTFTLKELVRRGQKTGPRLPGQPLEAWLDAVGEGREKSDLIGRSPEDEVADPLGGGLADYRATAAELADLTGQVARLLWTGAMDVPIHP